MQNLERLTASWHPSQIAKSLLLVIICLLLWFMPFSHDLCKYIDIEIATWLNQSLLFSQTWQFLWGYLNHPNETWLNIIFMLAVNVLGIFTIPKTKRVRAAALVLYCWLFFQIALLLTHKIFADWIEVQRNSPSLVIQPWIVLSELLNIENIKVYSHSSFPAGHVLVLVFWLKFIELYSNRWVQVLAAVTSVMLILPRMISGAHWLSDVIFTTFYAVLWFEIAVGTPLFAKAIYLLEKLILIPIPITTSKVKHEKRIY
jgi:membrane-associated phospholipid phosphatase